MISHRLFIGLLMIGVAGCSTTGGRRDALVNTPFANGGISQRSQDALKVARAAKGSDSSTTQTAERSLALDFSSVVMQCKLALEDNEKSLDTANNWALGVSIVGLVAGIAGSALVAKASASKSAIGALSGIAGSTNALQNQLKQSGRDPVEYTQRSTTIRQAILKTTKDFQSSDLEGQQTALRDLTATCVAYS